MAVASIVSAICCDIMSDFDDDMMIIRIPIIMQGFFLEGRISAQDLQRKEIGRALWYR
jgi:hypothetical protein